MKKFKVQLVRGDKKVNEHETDNYEEAVAHVSGGCRETGDTGFVMRLNDGFVMFRKSIN